MLKNKNCMSIIYENKHNVTDLIQRNKSFISDDQKGFHVII